MEFYETVKARRSIRAYRPDPVDRAVIERIAEAARLAPSACNRQAWRLVAVTNAEVKKKICSVCKQKFLAEAPVILLLLGAADKAYTRPGDDHSLIEIDMGIVFEHVLLAAAAEGLAGCWVCAYERRALDLVLNIDSPWSIYAISPLGYASEGPRPLDRVPFEQFFQMIESQ